MSDETAEGGGEVPSGWGFLEKALATLAGALAAYALGWRRERVQEQERRIEKFKTALFLLKLQRDFLLQLRTELVPYRGDPLAAYKIRPFIVHAPTETLDIEALAFLLVVAESETLDHFVLAQRKYRAVVTLLEAHGTAHTTFQEKLEAVDRAGELPQNLTIDTLRSVAGKPLSRRLEDGAGDLIRLTDDAITFNKEVLEKGAALFKRLYPRAGLFSMEDIPPAGPGQP